MSEANPITERVERIQTKTDRIQKLQDEVKKIAQKQKTADQKNREFEDVRDNIRKVQEQYERLMEWSEYGERMDISMPEPEINALIDNLATDLRSFTSKSFEDFDDDSEVRTLTTTFEDHRTSLSSRTDTVREAVQNTVEDEVDSVERTQTLLQVPDIGDDDAETTCDNYWYHLRQLQRGNLGNTSPKKWEKFNAEYEGLAISLNAYDLSEKSETLIWDLLNDDETVHLSDLDGETLSDLKTFEEFSDIIELRFSTQS